MKIKVNPIMKRATFCCPECGRFERTYQNIDDLDKIVFCPHCGSSLRDEK